MCLDTLPVRADDPERQVSPGEGDGEGCGVDEAGERGGQDGYR